jgi:hypothetical protein
LAERLEAEGYEPILQRLGEPVSDDEKVVTDGR